MRKQKLSVLLLSTIFLAPQIPAWAFEPAETDQLPEVVVTAQKRTEKLSDLTVTASVMTAETLQRENVSDISDINKLAPAVNLNGTFNGRVPLGIRGISSDSNEGAVGIASGVGIEVDGIPVPSDSFAANSVEDVTAVEVLEGPQATLGGRTASSGVIQFRTHQPTDVWHGDLTGTITGDDEKHIVGSISGPITNKVSFSLSGWDHYTRFPVENITSGDHSHQSEFGGRAKVKIAVTDDFDIMLMGRASQTESQGFNFAYSYVYPGAYILAGANGGPPFWSQQALFPSTLHLSPTNTQYASVVPDSDVYEHRFDTDGAVNLEYRIGEYTLTSTTAYQQERRNNTQDLFAVNEYFGTVAQAAIGAPFAFNNLQYAWINTKQWSEEAKIVSPAADRLNYVAGIFYSDTDVSEYGERHFTPAYSQTFIHPDTRTMAAYLHGNYKLFDSTTIVGGVRFNADQLKYEIDQQANPIPGFAPMGHFASSNSANSTALVGDIGIKQQITPTSQVYFTYTHGYAPGAYNTALALTNNTPLQPVAQESINSFELGTKGKYFNNSLEVNASLFDTIYNNYQINTFITVPGAAVALENLTAAGQAETQGLELNTTWKPLPDTTLGFNGALIRAVFNKYQDGPCWWSGPANMLPSTCYANADGSFQADLSGKTMPNAPRAKFAITANQLVPLGNLPYLLDLNASLTYRSRAQMLPDQNPQGFQDAYTLVNLSATLMDDEDRFSLTFFVNNVADKHYNVDVEDFWAAPWGSNAIVVQPGRDTNRYFGVKAGYHF